MRDGNPYRLDPAVRPESYNLYLRVDPDKDDYSGQVEIVCTTTTQASAIELNACDIEVEAVEIKTSLTSMTAQASLDNEKEILTVTPSSPLEEGEFTLVASFRGTLRRDLRGLYLSTYSDEQKQTRRLATTQFESTDARRAFPCFDEPEAKAAFTLTVEIPESCQAVSNYPVASEGPGDTPKWKRVTFAQTMKMSTYLLALVVGQLEFTPELQVGKVPVRLVTTPGKLDMSAFPLKVAAHALKFFEEWFGIPYPAPKLDLIAIPDFAAGAMENLGAVTFRETALLVTEEDASQAELERVCTVVSHELAHMWFGDLVTMKWWNGIWLNEAFATFMEVTASDHFAPEWHSWASFGVGRVRSLLADSLPSTRAIEYDVVAPSDAENMFDELTYEKGASILKMAEVYLGKDVFQQGIRQYLNAHRYSNTETSDLWAALDDASGEAVSEMMNTWVFQGGHPVVVVEPLPDGVRLTQSAFRLLDKESDPRGAIGTLWHVPVVVRDANGTESKVLMTQEEQTVQVPTLPAIVNAGGLGVYRTRYTQPLFAQIQEMYRDLAPLERFNLIADTWWCTLADQGSLEGAIDLMRRCQDEDDPRVLGVVSGALGFLDQIADEKQHSLVAKLTRTIFGPVIERIGLEPTQEDSADVKQARAVAFLTLGTIGEDPSVREIATQWFREDMSGVGGASGDLASPVLATVAYQGDESEFAFVLDRYRNAKDPQDENRHLFALPEFGDKTLAERVLAACLGEIRSQNAPYVINRVLANRKVGVVGIDFVFKHYQELLDRFPSNSHARMLESLALLIGPESSERAGEIFRFFGERHLPAQDQLLRRALERYRANLRARDRFVPLLTPLLERA